MMIFAILKSIGWFLLKSVFVGLLMEVCGYALYMVWYNQLPDLQQITKPYNNKFLYYTANGFEVVSVILLVYYDVQIWIIVPVVMLGSFIIDMLGNYFLERS